MKNGGWGRYFDSIIKTMTPPPPLFSAMTTPDLRLEGTPTRALGASLRSFVQPPCVGRGPFVFTKPGFAYRVPLDGGAAAHAGNFTWTVVADGPKPKALAAEVGVGDAVALWPGLTGYTLNDGCAAASIVLVTASDGDALVTPLKSYLEAGPKGNAPSLKAGAGGDGATWVDADCAARCGLKGAGAAAAPAPAKRV